MSGVHLVTGTTQRSDGVSKRRARALCLGLVAGGLLMAAFGPGVPSAAAATTGMVDLGQASTYAVLSGASVGNTVSGVGAPFTTLRGDLGVLANTQPTGFPPGVVTGTTRVGSSVQPAYADLVAAYGDVATRSGGAPLPGDVIGLTLTPGLHSTGAALGNTGTVTLDAQNDPNAIFVFKIGGAMTMAAGAQVKLINGASASRVFWQVNGAAAVGAGAKFAGTLMASAAIAVGAGTVFNGRALSETGAISLDSNDFYSAPPVITIAGGSGATTTDTTPTISGTTDVGAPGLVTVTIGAQTLSATPSPTDGSWSVTSAILPNGSYPVNASVVDGAGNPGSATQQLTIDTVPPVVTLSGGPSVLTNNPTPTISGTSDAAQGTIVRVSVDQQALTALVQSTGTWNVAPAALADGSRVVTAAVTDPAGNVGTASQQLTVDTTPPAVSITGGASALTNDATPDISGTAGVPAGAMVTVTVANQTLTGLVRAGGAWSVTAAHLPDGPHRVLMSVSDAAGNSAGFTQTLTVDTVAPAVAIDGGSTARSTNFTPTITGTSNAAPGTTVTVSIAGQTLTTLLQSNRTWNATPNRVGKGTWQIVASAPDPAGNVGRGRQTLTIATSFPPGSGGTGGKGGSGGTGGTGGTSRHLTVSLSSAKFKTHRGKRLAVAFVLSGPAKVTLTILRGKKVLAKLSGTRGKAGRGLLTWNVKIKQKLAPKGMYKITLRAVSPAGASASDTATLRIT